MKASVIYSIALVLSFFTCSQTSGQILQHVNKTGGTESSPIHTIDSIRFDGSGHLMEIIFKDGSSETHSAGDIINVTFSGSFQGSIQALLCNNAVSTGTLTEGDTASGVSSQIPYTGGNGGPHAGQSVTSTGVTGLTASATAGVFANGSGTLTYTITGIPDTAGTAIFLLNIGGQTCILERVVLPAPLPSPYPPGTVHCIANGAVIVDVINFHTGKIWMDRNLGASQVALTSIDINSYGDLYQWGRFSDGHQCRTPTITTPALSSTDQPGNNHFIITSSVPHDWRSPQNDNLWQGVNGINNPCPTGYRLPTAAEFSAEMFYWVPTNTSGAFLSPLKLPATGFRSASNGMIFYEATDGFYWTSTVSGTMAAMGAFDMSFAYSPNDYRANGAAVRCIKD
jgi:uncharacterized protein (TIGR02145 family)